MDWAQYLPTAIGLLGGAGGVAALLRARAQNKVDLGRLVFDQQAAFQQGLAAEVARLSALVQVLGTDKDKLEERLSDQGKLLERLKTLDEIKTLQIEKLEGLNKELSARVDEQQREIGELREQKATIGQQLATTTAEKGFLERENGVLRLENKGLRADLDAARGIVVPLMPAVSAAPDAPLAGVLDGEV